MDVTKGSWPWVARAEAPDVASRATEEVHQKLEGPLDTVYRSIPTPMGRTPSRNLGVPDADGGVARDRPRGYDKMHVTRSPAFALVSRTICTRIQGARRRGARTF